MLREFFMEDWLERHRCSSLFNLGESGHRALDVAEFLRLVDLPLHEANKQFLEISLRDSPNWGRYDLRQAVAELHMDTSAEEVLITNGTSEALFLLLGCLRPKKIALILPGFQLLYEVPQANGAAIVPLPVEFDSKGIPQVNWEHWFEILEHERPDALLFNHPHNPTGLIFSEEELALLVSYCKSANIFLIADEHYRFLASDDFPLGPSLLNAANKLHATRVAVTGSFIKCVGAPGLRVGWCVSKDKILAEVQNAKNYTTHTVNPLTEWLSYLALRNTKCELFTEARNIWLHNRLQLQEFLDSNSAWLGRAPMGGLVSCIAPALPLSTEKFAGVLQNMLEEGLFLLPLSTIEFKKYCGTGSAKWQPNFANGFGFRIGLGCGTEKFTLALNALAKIKMP